MLDSNMYFTDEDKEKVVKFLKLIKEKGKFEHTAPEAVEFVTTWLFMEQTILKKISANILGKMKEHKLPEKAAEEKPVAKKKTTAKKPVAKKKVAAKKTTAKAARMAPWRGKHTDVIARTILLCPWKI